MTHPLEGRGYPIIDGDFDSVESLAEEIANLQPGDIFGLYVAGVPFTISGYGDGPDAHTFSAECHASGMHGYQEVSFGTGEIYPNVAEAALALGRWIATQAGLPGATASARTVEKAALNVVTAQANGTTPSLADVLVLAANLPGEPKGAYQDAVPDSSTKTLLPGATDDTTPRTTRPGVRPSTPQPPPDLDPTEPVTPGPSTQNQGADPRENVITPDKAASVRLAARIALENPHLDTETVEALVREASRYGSR